MAGEASASTAAMPAAAGRGWRRSALALARAGMLAVLVWLIGVNAQRGGDASGVEQLGVGDVAEWFAAAASLGDVGEDGGRAVLDGSGETLGRVFGTRPVSDAIRGYSGPTHLLIACGADGRCLGVRISGSGDTVSHRAMVEEDGGFLAQWNGLTVSEFPRPGEVDVVSGASLTSEAIARSLRARFSGEDLTAPFPREFPAEELRAEFPTMASWQALDGRRESFELLDGDGVRLAVVLRTGNRADAVRGFNGAHDLLICLDAGGGRIERVLLRDSRDNDPYVGHVRDEIKWTDFLVGKAVDDWLAQLDNPERELLVSGASVTVRSVVMQVAAALREWRAPAVHEPLVRWQMRDTWLALWAGLAMVLGWGAWRGGRRVRLQVQVASVAIGGVWLGVMIGQGLFIGWARDGVPWRTAPALVLLTAAALLLPLVSGRNPYCERVCPHGAAQALLFRMLPWRQVVAGGFDRWLRRIPGLVLAVVGMLAVLGWRGDLAGFEPFDVWSAWWYALIPGVLWVVGLVVSGFVPKAYCHYGCPTGELLRFLGGRRASWSRRDSLAVVLLVIAFMLTFSGIKA